MQKYDFTVFIGRFQPFHAGHLSIVEEALRRSDKLIIVCGSKEKPSSSRNPLTFEQRKELISAAIGPELMERISVVGVCDHEYNLQRWIGDVQSAVFTETNKVWRAGPTKIALIGHKKDHTSYYLNLFPNWSTIDCMGLVTLDGTALRKFLHSGIYDPIGTIRTMHEPFNVEMREEWYDTLNKLYTQELSTKMEDHKNFIKDYKKQWGNGPFITSDALVVQSGFILLIERGPGDGEGLWAIPGGFINSHERLVDAAIRELVEETRIKIPEQVLRGSIVREKIYDDPWRSERARLITHAILIQLKDGPVPKVKGSDDARNARWFSISEFKTMRSKMFEDHFSMVSDLLGI